MAARWLADAVVVGHLAFIAFAVLGGFLVRRWPWLVLLHLPCVAWAVYVELSGATCPLTPLEQGLRRAAGEAGYRGGFVEHYVLALIYPAGLTRATQVVLGAAVLALNAWAYAPMVAARLRRACGAPRRS